MSMLRLNERACNVGGDYELNISNPLTRGLIFCAPGMRDVISGSVAVPVLEYSSTKSAKKTSRYGVGLQSLGVHNGGFVFRNVPNVQSRIVGNDKATMAFLGETLTWTANGVIFGIPANDATWVRPWLCLGISRNSLNNQRLRFGYSYTTGGTPDFSSSQETSGLIGDQIRCYGVIKRPGAGQQLFCADRSTAAATSAQAGAFWSESSSVYLFSRNTGNATSEGVQDAAVWMACIWDRDLSLDEWLSFQSDPFQILRKKAQSFYFLPDLGLSLSLSSMNLALSLDAPELAQANTLALADVDLAIDMDALVLSGSEQLGVASVAMQVDSDSPGLLQNNVLSAVDMAVALSVDSVALSQAGVLAIAALDVGLSVDAVSLLQANVISVAGMDLAIEADAVALTQANILSVADAAFGLVMGSVALSTADFLVVNELSLAGAIDAVALVQANVLVVADMALQSASDSIVLALNSVLSVADLGAAIALDSVVLDQSSVLVISGIDLGISAESPALLQQNALSVNDARLSILMDSLTIGGGVFVTESALGMIVRDFQYVLLVEG